MIVGSKLDKRKPLKATKAILQPSYHEEKAWGLQIRLHPAIMPIIKHNIIWQPNRKKIIIIKKEKGRTIITAPRV
jgi:hypothetical protein